MCWRILKTAKYNCTEWKIKNFNCCWFVFFISRLKIPHIICNIHLLFQWNSPTLQVAHLTGCPVFKHVRIRNWRRTDSPALLCAAYGQTPKERTRQNLRWVPTKSRWPWRKDPGINLITVFRKMSARYFFIVSTSWHTCDHNIGTDFAKMLIYCATSGGLISKYSNKLPGLTRRQR
jgi:hypothetical protein